MEKVEQYFQKSINELSDELKPMIRSQLLTQKMQYDITKNVNVSPLEVANFYGKKSALFITTRCIAHLTTLMFLVAVNPCVYILTK